MTRHAGLLPRLRALAIVLTSTTLFFGATALEAESLLACVTAGLIAANRRRGITARVTFRAGQHTRGVEQPTGLGSRACSFTMVACTRPTRPVAVKHAQARDPECVAVQTLLLQTGEARLT